jgi:hypothetical protein
MNKELASYHAVTAEEIMQESQNIFVQDNSNTLYYYSKN